MKQIVIAPDSFKGSLSAREVAEAIRRGVAKADPACGTLLIPMADGGEGTADCLVTATNGRMERTIARDPLGREIESAYGVLGEASGSNASGGSASGGSASDSNASGCNGGNASGCNASGSNASGCNGGNASGCNASGSNASGGSASGGSASGGSASASNASGGSASGSSASGSNASGGSASGGSGGNASGCNASGGSASGSNASGSNASGSSASGSNASGSNASGGSASGGSASGSNASASNASGSNASGSNASETFRASETGSGYNGAAGSVGVIEMALSSGLYLIKEEERDPLRTTTYGFGQLIRAALDQGCRTMILALGGSATNDGGAGMLQALGAELLDRDGVEIGCGGGELGKLSEIRTEGMDARLRECEFVVACDVDNPFVGPRGASIVFGPQKGATEEMAEQLDRNLAVFADAVERSLGVRIHDMPGAGAAGGLAGAIFAFLNGRLESGVSIVARFAGLDAALQTADLVITGEGRVDGQTTGGKTPFGVAKTAQSHGVPVVVLAGSIGEGIEALYEHGVTSVFSIVNRPMTLAEAMRDAEALLEQCAEQVVRTIHYSSIEPLQ